MTAAVFVYCALCRNAKAPVGRSVPMGMDLCADSCEGYRQAPLPDCRWPGEEYCGPGCMRGDVVPVLGEANELCPATPRPPLRPLPTLEVGKDYSPAAAPPSAPEPIADEELAAAETHSIHERLLVGELRRLRTANVDLEARLKAVVRSVEDAHMGSGRNTAAFVAKVRRLAAGEE